MKLAIVIAVCLFCIACNLTPEQHMTLQNYFAEELAAGRITQDQYDALLAALAGNNWSDLLKIAASVGLSIIGALTGANFMIKKQTAKMVRVTQ